MERLMQQFEATDEQGTTRRLMVYQDFVDAATMGNPNVEVPGLKRIVTEDGQNVNRLETGKYQIVQTGEVLTSSAPDAP